MNRKFFWSALCVVLIAALGACGGGKSTPPPPVETIVTTSGSGQSAVTGATFAAPLVATVSTGGTPNSGVSVTFTAPSSGASVTFNSGATTATVTTDSNGLATSPSFTANGTSGAYSITATASGVTTPASFSLTNTASPAAQYSFILGGQEPQFDDNYGLAGSVSIDANGNVVGGEQDFNDGDDAPLIQDTITGGTLSVNPTTGQGTLTLITNDANVGNDGTETLGVEFVNTNHAMIINFDGSATSSGSLDTQTLTFTAPALKGQAACKEGCPVREGISASTVQVSGSYAFSFTGQDPDFFSVVVGGVFTAGDGAITTGMFDFDDDGTPILGTSITGGTVTGPDSFGRGTMTFTYDSTGAALPVTVVYYIVGPEAIRFVDMDNGDTGFGSAFGQGTSAGSFSNSLGSAVFSLQSNPEGNPYSTAGSFATAVPGVAPRVHPEGIPSNVFNGIADVNEEGDVFEGQSISGSYVIFDNGYGSLTINTGNLEDVSQIGVYAVDPNINILDPNNTTSGTGGALLVDLDTVLNGTGILLPQTDVATSSFTGNYSFGASLIAGCDGICEIDFAGQGAASVLTSSSGFGNELTGNGLWDDPAELIGETSPTANDVTFNGQLSPDEDQTGRYFMSDLELQSADFDRVDFSFTVFQANGGQLVWTADNESGLLVGSGTLQQQGSLTGIPQPAVKKAAAKAKKK